MNTGAYFGSRANTVSSNKSTAVSFASSRPKVFSDISFMPALLVAIDGGVGTPIVAQGVAGTFSQNQPQE